MLIILNSNFIFNVLYLVISCLLLTRYKHQTGTWYIPLYQVSGGYWYLVLHAL
jgi:hypothetical protein